MDIGIVGTGMIGGALALDLGATRHRLLLARRRRPETLADLVAAVGPNATAVTVEEALAAGMVILAVPFCAVFGFPADRLAGKIVVDPTNYYPNRDGHVDELDRDQVTSTELVARALPGARVVKAFNTMYYQRLRDGRPAGASNRIAVPVAGDDPEAKATVSALVDEIGFDPVDTGSLAQGGRLLQPGGPGFNRVLTRSTAQAALGLPG
jgi:predicted dinucleotide-binding enzyme